MYKNIVNPKKGITMPQVPIECDLKIWELFNAVTFRMGLGYILNFWLERKTSPLMEAYLTQLCATKGLEIEDFEMKIFPDRYNVYTAILTRPEASYYYYLTCWKVTSSYQPFTRYELRKVFYPDSFSP